MHYKHLTLKERYQISAYKKVGYTQSQIAQALQVNVSTISRELSRNTLMGYYHPEAAERLCYQRHKHKIKSIKMTPVIKQYIKDKLKCDWAPEQIAGVMQKEKCENAVSYESIYRYIYENKAHGGKLYQHLRHKNKKYHKRGNEYNTRGLLKNRISISQKPKIVEKKTRVGDWEIDTMIGANHQGALVTIVDRCSKFALIKHVPSKHANIITHAVIEMMLPIRKITHTITSDNGKEFAYHQHIAKELQTQFYFANAYHSWERGLNEHTNGLIRQYLPKQTDFTKLKKEQIQFIQDRLNHRPRKSLGYKTPAEVFYATIIKQLAS